MRKSRNWREMVENYAFKSGWTMEMLSDYIFFLCFVLLGRSIKLRDLIKKKKSFRCEKQLTIFALIRTCNRFKLQPRNWNLIKNLKVPQFEYKCIGKKTQLNVSMLICCYQIEWKFLYYLKKLVLSLNRNLSHKYETLIKYVSISEPNNLITIQFLLNKTIVSLTEFQNWIRVVSLITIFKQFESIWLWVLVICQGIHKC